MASREQHQQGRAELADIRRQSRRLFWAVGLFSVFINALMLTGPLFMLQVYDRVLASRSEATLVALFLLVAFLYTMMGILDAVRGRLLARIGARFQSALDERVFSAMLRRASVDRDAARRSNALADLEGVQKFLSSPILAALFDLPFTPVFLFGIALFHPWLGILALVGGAVLVLITLINQITSRAAGRKGAVAGMVANRTADQLKNEAEMVRSLGMRRAGFARWQKSRDAALEASVATSDRTTGFGALSRTLRLFLQSAMLGLGAYLVLQEQLTPGAMIAGSILLGRALQPIDVTIGQWPTTQRAMAGWNAMADLLGEVPPEDKRTDLPRPRAHLLAQQVTIAPPGAQQAALKGVSFELKPGQALGVIGPSGSGKSTLARALTGVWRPMAGKLRLDGAALDQYDPDLLADYIGYLPQRVQVFDGTIKENIARLSPTPDDAQVIAAAKKAAAHDMILQFPEGYDTYLSASDSRLSGGQLQRIGLARALYGDPVLLVLDEPNSNLDNTGSMALNVAIRAMKDEGKAVLIMAHRPAAIRECDLLLVLDQGVARAFGPRDDVLAETVQNHTQIAAQKTGGGVN